MILHLHKMRFWQRLNRPEGRPQNLQGLSPKLHRKFYRKFYHRETYHLDPLRKYRQRLQYLRYRNSPQNLPQALSLIS